MRRPLLNLALMLAPALSLGVVIDFSDIDTDSGLATWSGSRYQHENVLFSGGTLAAAEDAEAPGTNMIGASSTSSGTIWDRDLEITFQSISGQRLATNFVSFTVREFGPPNLSNSLWDVRIYDLRGRELDRMGSNGFNVPVEFSRSQADIHRIVFRPTSNQEGIGAITFNPVPEPGTISALVLGSGALFLRRKRAR